MSGRVRTFQKGRPSVTQMLWAFAIGCLIAGLGLLFYSPGAGPSQTQEKPDSASTTPSRTTKPSDTPTTPQLPEEEGEVPDLHQEESAEPFVPAVWDAVAEQDALAAGRSVMQAWLTTASDQWWPTLEPLMNVNAAEVYSSVDPERIAPATISGEPTIASAPSPYYVEVTVPTSGGNYVVSLTRDEAGAPWLAERLYQPETAVQGAGA